MMPSSYYEYMTYTSLNQITDSFDDLAWAIDKDGIEAHADAVAAVMAPLAGRVNARLLAILADAGQPSIVRARAFGAVVAEAANSQSARSQPAMATAA